MRQRSDAERNGHAVLAATLSLYAEDARVGAVSLDEVAERAGVGKGTVFRAFGDKAGLLRAAMAACVEPVQRRLEDLDAADPVDRVELILDALLQVKIANRRLSVALEELGLGSPFHAETYGWWWERLRREVVAAGVDQPDLTAHLLLGSVRSDLVEHLLLHGWTPERLRTSVRVAARRLCLAM